MHHSRQTSRCSYRLVVGALAVLFGVVPLRCIAADTIEFLSGTKAEGTITQIDKAAKKVTFETTIANKKLTRVYNYSVIHAVTYQGQRYVLTEKNSDTRAGSG